MLQTTKSINISGSSIINGAQVANFSANIRQQDGGNTSINQNIINQDLYDSNKAAVRQDAAAFNEAVYAEEDRLASDDSETPAPTE